MSIAADLPLGWVAAKLGDVCGVCAQRELLPDEKFVYVDVGSVDRDTKAIREPQALDGKDAPSRARKIIQAGDVIVSMTRPNLNAVALVSEAFDGQIASTGFEVLRPAISNELVFYVVRSQPFVEAMSQKVQGALYPAVKSTDIREFEFSLPPLAEQKQIAAQLDALLAQVDTLKARLDAIPIILKRFRQSVLSAAVSGRLTEGWRGNLEYVDGFPACWKSMSLSELGELSRGKSKHRPRNDSKLFGGKHPFIQTGEVANCGGVIKAASNFYSDFGLAQSRLFPVGTLCITIAANIADTAILGIDACFPDSVVGFIPGKKKCLALYAKYFIDSNKSNIERFAPATAQKNINLKILNELRLPFPNFEEQTEIVRRVEELFAFADQIEQRVHAAQARVKHLTQSILAKAFRGELTVQWRAENPELISGENSAQALLERIGAAREKQAPKGKGRGKRP